MLALRRECRGKVRCKAELSLLARMADQPVQQKSMERSQAFCARRGMLNKFAEACAGAAWHSFTGTVVCECTCKESVAVQNEVVEARYSPCTCSFLDQCTHEV